MKIEALFLRLLIICTLPAINSSCMSESETWLNAYRQSKCSLKQVYDKIEKESAEQTRGLRLQKDSLDNLLTKAREKYTLRKEKIKEISSGITKKFYDDLSNLRKEHTSAYGSTNERPEVLEKKVSDREKRKEIDLMPYNIKFAQTEEEERNDPEVLRIAVEINKVSLEIVNLHTGASEKYKDEVQRLDGALAELSKKYTEVMNTLSKDEQKNFTDMVNAINASPCQ